MATNRAYASYQEVIDLHTESDTVSAIGIHTPTTKTPVKMLAGFWKQFKKVRYYGCSISLVPAARLPADPLQVSYEAGETTIDPRDLLNPILFHGCHGNDMGSILNTLYAGNIPNTDVSTLESDSIGLHTFSSNQIGNDAVEALYYKAMTDNTWLKAHPMRGFKKSGLHPKVYTLASNMQLNPFDTTAQGSLPGSSVLSPTVNATDEGGNVTGNASNGTLGLNNSTQNQTTRTLPLQVATMPGQLKTTVDGELTTVSVPGSKRGMAFMTPRLTSLGWLDTYQMAGYTASPYAVTGDASNDALSVAAAFEASHIPALIPRVFMGMILLPPAYKTEQYFRMVINHRFGFAGFRGASMYDYTYDTPEMIQNRNVRDMNTALSGTKSNVKEVDADE